MNLLKQAYNREAYLDFLAEKFNFSPFLDSITTNNDQVKSFQQLGFITTPATPNNKQLPVFEIHIKPNTQLSRNRVQLRNLVAQQIGSEDGALAVYVDEKNRQWRFSFIAIEYRFTDGGVKKEQTASKRFTYLLGENTNTRTAKKRFEKLNQQSTLEDLKQAFSVETLSNEFYKELYKWYGKAQTQVVFPNDEHAENHTQTSLIRLLTRLLFIWFIKEKSLINPDLFDQAKLQTLIDYDKPSSFYKAILQNLFFATLSTEIKNRDFRNEEGFQGKNKDYGNQYRYRYHDLVNDLGKWKASFGETPFLNGGLFESLDVRLNKYVLDEKDKPKKDNEGKEIINQEHKKRIDEWSRDKTIRAEKTMLRMEGFSEHVKNVLEIPNNLFFNDDKENLGLITLFNQYQFTVEESTPLDIEVALDPELLGKVFENLLASYNPETGQQARKATGSFYTPREIVSYMVDESIKAYLLEKVAPHDGDTEFYQQRLSDLITQSDTTGEADKDDKPLIYPEEIPKLITAISQIKILDPAVGSGAYPMGILQRLVALLVILDPDNKHWKKQKLAELPDLQSIEADIKMSKKISDVQASQKAQTILEDKKREIITNFENQDHNYLRKLYLIEQCIYGVDIQPIAIQICKLRFFISLTIEQAPNQDENDNYGIKALPNLETKFIVANSLLPLGEMPDQFSGLFDTGIAKLQKELAEIRHKHFSAKTLTTKRKYREKDKSLRNKMLAELTKSGITPAIEESMRKIVHWDLYNQNAVADWFDPEWQFGIKDGFDIVIGNPPYISHDRISKKDKKIIQNNYLSYEPFADLYCYFFEKSVTLQREKGVLCLITSNSFLRAEYGKPTRYFLSNNNCLLKVLNIHKSQIFDKAIVNVSIVISCKTKGDIVCDVINSQIGDKFSELIKNTLPYKQIYFDEFPWRLIPPKLITLKNKIKSTGKTLEELQTKIRLGLATGSNEAFVIDEKTKQQLCANSKNSDIIKPILRGRDIDKYSYRISGLYILLTKNGVNAKRDYPKVYTYLLSFGDKFKNRGAQGEHWSNLRACSFYDDFKKDKIIWIELTDKGRFALSADEVYLLNSAYYLIPPEDINSKFLLAVLNSKIIYFYLNLIAETSGMGTNRWINNYVKKFPIPQISKPAQQPFIALVDKILTAKQNITDTTAMEDQIDEMVYKLYNLTDDEIAIIEKTK